MKDRNPRIYWDSSVWISWNRNNFDVRELCSGLLASMERGELDMVISALNLAEFAPQDEAVDHLLESYLKRSGIRFVSINKHIAIQARSLVRKYKGLPGSDAVHIACALHAEADFLFSTDDKHMLKFAQDVKDTKICRPCWLGQTQFIFETASTEESSW